MQLRPYQIEAKRWTYKSLKKHSRTMLQLPTGAGKTITFVDITRDYLKWNKKVMILVHRKELIEQTIDKLFRFNMQCSVIQRDFLYKHYAKVHVASVPTLASRISKGRMLPKDIDLIICDEAHHSTANSYRKIYEYYNTAQLLGVSATPCRTNGEGFEDIFNDLVVGTSVSDLIKIGHLVKPKVIANPLSFDLKTIKLTAGEFNAKELSEAINKNITFGDYVRTWELKAKGLKTVVFANDVEHSQKIVELYNKAGYPAEHIDGTTPKEQRKQTLKNFATGKTTILSNVGIVTEGFDVPEIECVQLTKPTTSLSLYLQMVGRGLRPAQGKEACIILDHADNVFSHGFPEQDRKWTLKGKKIKKNEKPQYKIRDKRTGKIFERNQLPEHLTDFELVEVTANDARIKYLHKLISVSRYKKFKIGWAWHCFLDKYKIPTAEECKSFERIAGYKIGWAKHQQRKFGLIK